MSLIVKLSEDPDDTRYIRWSGNTDSWTHLFTTEKDVVKYLLDDYPRNNWKGIYSKSEFVEARIQPEMDLARETGTNGRFNTTSHFRFDAAPSDMIMFGQSGMFHRTWLEEVVTISMDCPSDWNDVQVGQRLLEEGILKPFED